MLSGIPRRRLYSQTVYVHARAGTLSSFFTSRSADANADDTYAYVKAAAAVHTLRSTPSSALIRVSAAPHRRSRCAPRARYVHPAVRPACTLKQRCVVPAKLVANLAWKNRHCGGASLHHVGFYFARVQHALHPDELDADVVPSRVFRLRMGGEGWWRHQKPISQFIPKTSFPCLPSRRPNPLPTTRSSRSPSRGLSLTSMYVNCVSPPPGPPLLPVRCMPVPRPRRVFLSFPGLGSGQPKHNVG